MVGWFRTGNPQLHIERGPNGWKVSDPGGPLAETEDWEKVRGFLNMEVGPGNDKQGLLRNILGKGAIGAFREPRPAPKLQPVSLSLEDLEL